jgi:hypothetical protein
MKPFQSFHFQTQRTNIVQKYFFFKRYIHTTTIVKFHKSHGMPLTFFFESQDFNFCFLVFIWLLVVHIFIMFQSSILDSIFEPLKQTNTLQ